MARRNKPDTATNPEFDAALERATLLAGRLAAGLTGEELSPEGRVEAPCAARLASAMIYFLLRLPPDDLHTLFFAEGSLKEAMFKPQSRRSVVPALFADC